MYVCICHAFTDRQVKDAVRNGITSVDGVFARLGGPAQCGHCIAAVRELIAHYGSGEPDTCGGACRPGTG